MRGKDYNAGLRGVLFEAQHYERMGTALWLYGWLVLRQTHQSGYVGWVLGGAPINYREIEVETGFNRRTLERWMHTLRRHGYIETEAVPGGMSVRITKAKKFPQAPRKVADGVRKAAGGRPPSCGAPELEVLPNEQVAGGIYSSSVVGTKDITTPDTHSLAHCQARVRSDENHTPTPTPSGLGSTQNQPSGASPSSPSGMQRHRQQNVFPDAHMLRQWLRAEREEAVRRELAVGTGPEVPRR